MYKKLYINGCSWTDGDVLDLTGLTQMGTGRNYSYPKLVAKKFKLLLTDESRYGGSINRIIRMTWDYIIKEKNLIKDTIFILEIPNGFRDEIYSTEFEKYFNITGGLLSNPEDKTETSDEWNFIKKDVINNYYNFHDFELFDKKESINFMSLISYIKTNGGLVYLLQPYDFINRMGRYNGIFNDTISDNDIIKLKHTSFLKEEYYLIQDMCEYEKLSIGDELNNGKKDTHPGISGHLILSEIIIKQISKKINNKII